MSGENKACVYCAGTGFMFMANSAFTDDGYSRSKCSICGGTGESNYRPMREMVAFQRTARIRVDRWGALRPSPKQQNPASEAGEKETT